MFVRYERAAEILMWSAKNRIGKQRLSNSLESQIYVIFQDCLLDHMEISIVEAEKRANRALNLREFYTVYLIETKWVKRQVYLLHLQYLRNVNYIKKKKLLHQKYISDFVLPESLIQILKMH